MPQSPGMERHFDPVTLRLFVAVCEERNIARAAEREAIVPSAVSKRIAAIEHDIGAPLLVRGRRGIEPTAAGEALLRQARELLGAMERMHAELSDFATGVHGSVRVVASVSVLAERLPDDIGAFLKRYQSVRVSLDERVSSDIVRSVREGAADLGVLWDAADLRGLQSVPYRRDYLCVAVHPAHPLASHERVRFEQTLDHAAIGVAPGGMMETMLRRQAALAGRTIAYRIQVSSLDAACRIVAAGLGLAVMPREAIAPDASAAGLVLVPLADAWAERRFVVCMREEASLPATARLLVEHLGAQA
ncbi:MAG TPA: LysR family transcriptional regulator [Albitalea sp.]|uniref:LysR family transcriptional regulator n=1 Tax=Piscinibacter sp. TaxID=1903157 RepID=UPI002ED68A52